MLALISFIILTKRRKITLENIKIAFPEKSLIERSIIATKSYINLAEEFINQENQSLGSAA